MSIFDRLKKVMTPGSDVGPHAESMNQSSESYIPQDADASEPTDAETINAATATEPVPHEQQGSDFSPAPSANQVDDAPVGYSQANRMRGIIEFWNDRGGWGKIAPNEPLGTNGQESVFIHYESIEDEHEQYLFKGEEVEFTVDRNEKGFYAP